MASQQDVQKYLAYWFQLGKSIVVNNQQPQLPAPIFHGNDYSPAFKTCWHAIMAHNGEDSYLEGTDQTIAELLQPAWEFSDCARCEMPIPMRVVGYEETICPCNDLLTWPNQDIPTPRSPVDTQGHLISIQKRLSQSTHTYIDEV